MIYLSSVVYALLFLITSKVFPADPSSIDSYSIVQVFDQYASYAGLGFALLSLLLMLILTGIFSLLGLKKNRFKKPLLVFLGFAPWAVFGYQLIYREPRYANIAKAIIEYLGEPMLYSSLILMGFGVLLFVTAFKKPSS
jgi:hypothetical protein